MVRAGSPARSCRSRPTCGVASAKQKSRGPFAMDRFPLLLLEEESRLTDMPLRENVIERVLPVEKYGLLAHRATL